MVDDGTPGGLRGLKAVAEALGFAEVFAVLRRRSEELPVAHAGNVVIAFVWFRGWTVAAIVRGLMPNRWDIEIGFQFALTLAVSGIVWELGGLYLADRAIQKGG